MHYLGSKARHADDIIAITCANRRADQWYVEPFVGGGNMINKVPQGAGRIANDKNYGMTALLHALGNLGWTPPETMTKTEWSRIMKKRNALKTLPLLEQAEFAFAATGPTFGSMWDGQRAKDYPGMEGTRYRQARDAALKDAPGLKGILFYDGEYSALTEGNVIPPGSIVYCDPPYANTTEYNGAKVQIPVGTSTSANVWKPSRFWQWCDHLIDDMQCVVYVSEYTGPQPSAYPTTATAEQKARRAALAATFRTIQADAKSTPQQIQEATWPINEIDEEIAANSVALAARWKVVWSKEVTSDFSASRGSAEEGDGGKKETECLFHRE